MARGSGGGALEVSNGATLQHDGQERTAQERNLRALRIVAATNNTAWDLVTPFIPLFILTLVEGDPVAAAAWSGVALGVSPLMTAVAGSFWGVFTERYGARSAMLRTLAIAPCLVVMAAFTTAIWHVLILRFPIGAGLAPVPCTLPPDLTSDRRVVDSGV